MAKLASWRHPGFSAHVGEPIAPEEKRRLEDTAAYRERNSSTFAAVRATNLRDTLEWLTIGLLVTSSGT